MVWRQGEHVTLIGPTGSGKTTLALAILPKRTYKVVIATKPKDSTFAQLRENGYKRVSDWPPRNPFATSLVYWPRIERPSDIPAQRESIRELLESAYTAGGWSLYCDEVRYITSYLRLSPLVELLWQQGRSLGVSIIAGTQRPRHIPLYAYDQATHLFMWRDNDSENLRRLSGLGAAEPQIIRRAVPRLHRHEILYVNTVTGDLYVTKVRVT